MNHLQYCNYALFVVTALLLNQGTIDNIMIVPCPLLQSCYWLGEWLTVLWLCPVRFYNLVIGQGNHWQYCDCALSAFTILLLGRGTVDNIVIWALFHFTILLLGREPLTIL